MTDLPILFSAPMVLAQLREVDAPGTGKTQTRRLFKPHPTMHPQGDCSINGHRGPVDYLMREVAPRFWTRFKKGQRLWVRETWRTGKSLDEHSPAKIEEMVKDAGYRRPWCPVRYVADGFTEGNVSDFGGLWGKARVAIHMPRWLSRLTLTVTDVRVQRLQEISEEDALAEGVMKIGRRWEVDDIVATPIGAVDAYRSLWNCINGAGIWDANPWIVALTFTVAKQNIDALKEAA
jgi:hypothetical protein